MKHADVIARLESAAARKEADVERQQEHALTLAAALEAIRESITADEAFAATHRAAAAALRSAP